MASPWLPSGSAWTPVSAGKVNHWLRGTRRVSLEEALQIEVLTQGEVGLRELVNPRTAEIGAAHA
ncbi:hypothetical protein ACHFCA_21660 [Delftia tsuruhatensis]